MNNNLPPINPDDIAIIGMSCRFPKAANVREFWNNLAGAEECITFYTDEELNKAGVPPQMYEDPAYVKASGAIEDIEYFDAKFFDFSPKEASLIDPQQRIFLEEAFRALEDAGCNPADYKGAVGVYASTGMNTYLYHNLGTHAELMEEGGGYPVMISSDKDFLATRTSYKLNLKGPSMTIQTACSSSLVAIHCACEALRSGECDCALAGGVSIRVPQKAGYLYHEGLILSPDGHCRAFDEKAQGTVFGNGAGVIVLKMLTDAVEDGDEIYAVIKGSAINNDGSVKAGYTAPGLEAQAAVIYEALSVSDISPKDISYVETHGTGTSIGDPIEIAALTRAFKEDGIEPGTCAIGSVKTNIGHLDTASGVAGIIKTALALHNRMIPASLNFDKPNPKIDFTNSPFYVNTSLRKWESSGPRRAGVSSFGIGGTNAHVILEEAPVYPAGKSGQERVQQILVLSAKSGSALDKKAEEMAAYLAGGDCADLRDVCYTASCCRSIMSHRLSFACDSAEEAAEILSDPDRHIVYRGIEDNSPKSAVFLFPGQGSQHVNMGLALYQTEKYFRDTMDECFGIVKGLLGTDLKEIIYPQEGKEEEAEGQLRNTLYTQPSLFIIEYSLAKLLMHWGIKPAAMAGHSLGEYAAACLANVFTLEEALRLVVTRAKLISGLPGGSMLSVQLGEKELLPYLEDGVSVAALNADKISVLSGTKEAVDRVREKLTGLGIVVKELATSHAFHSAMLDPILPEFEAEVQKIQLKIPEIPYVSTYTGEWQKDEDALSVQYWVNHLRGTVRFYDAAATLLERQDAVFIEVGPGKALSSLLRRHPDRDQKQVIVNTLPHQRENTGADRVICEALAKLWAVGGLPDWKSFYNKKDCRKVRIPSYPFDKKKCWIEPAKENIRKNTGHYYAPVYKRAENCPEYNETEAEPGCCLIFRGDGGFGSILADKLIRQGGRVAQVRNGTEYRREDELNYTLPMSGRIDYEQLFGDISGQETFFNHVVYLWGLERQADSAEHFRNLVTLLQYLKKGAGSRRIRLTAVVREALDISGCETVNDRLRPLEGLAQTVRSEGGSVSLQLIDIGPATAPDTEEAMAERLCTELAGSGTEVLVALRGRARWVFDMESITAAAGKEKKTETEKNNYLYFQKSAVGSGMEWYLEDTQGERTGGLSGDGIDLTDSGDILPIKKKIQESGRGLGGILYRPADMPAGRKNLLTDYDAGRFEENILKLRGELRNIQDILSGGGPEFIAVLSSRHALGLENCWLKSNIAWRNRQGGCPWIYLECEDEEVPAGPLLRLLGRRGAASLPDTVMLSSGNPYAAAADKEAGDEGGGLKEDTAVDRMGFDNPYAAPCSNTEKTLVKIWENILGAGSIGVNDNFFELGGTSLMITQILSGIRKELGEMPVTVKDIYENQTIHKLGEYIDAIRHVPQGESRDEGGAAYEEGEI